MHFFCIFLQFYWAAIWEVNSGRFLWEGKRRKAGRVKMWLLRISYGGKFPSEILSCPPGAGPELSARNVSGGIAQKSAASAERNQQLRQSHINLINLQKRQNWKTFIRDWEIDQGHIFTSDRSSLVLRYHIAFFKRLNTAVQCTAGSFLSKLKYQFTQLNATQCNSMQLNAIQCNSMRVNATFATDNTT